MNVLTPNQEIFSAQLSKQTGLDHNVVRGWVLAEESAGAARSRDAAGNMNWLNLAVGPSGDRFNAGWTDPITAANNTAAALKGTKYKTGSNYAGIMATAHGHPGDQIQAIADSPWSSDHYGGGSHLVSTYHLVSGLPAPKINASSTPPVTSDPKTRETAAQTPLKLQAEVAASAPLSYLKGSGIALPDLSGNTPAPSLHLKGSKIPLPPYGIDVPLTVAPATPKVSAPPITPKSKPTGTASPSGAKTGKFEGTTVAAWMIPALVYARAHGWTGKLTSGVRTTAEQAVLYQRYKAGGNIAAKPGQSNHEIQNGGAFDATNASQLNSVLKGFNGKRPIWAISVGLNDTPHFSSTGH